MPAEPASRDSMIKYLEQCIEVARRGKSLGHHPFGSILVGPEGQVLLQQCNYSPVHHAESELVRVAYTNFPPEYLEKCTLYTSVEPCAMCSGSAYWANIGTIVYGMSEEDLYSLTTNSKENPTLRLPCREVLKCGSRDITVVGPFPELVEKIAKDHRDFWDNH